MKSRKKKSWWPGIYEGVPCGERPPRLSATQEKVAGNKTDPAYLKGNTKWGRGNKLYHHYYIMGGHNTVSK